METHKNEHLRAVEEFLKCLWVTVDEELAIPPVSLPSNQLELLLLWPNNQTEFMIIPSNLALFGIGGETERK